MRIVPALLSIALAFPAAAWAETHEVKLLNRNETGPMPYEPDFLKIAPGDTVRFLPTTASHNAATIDGMIPEGHDGFTGPLNREFEVTFDREGFYGIKCTPHYAMGMVMIIQVGDGPLPESFVPNEVPARAKKRFEEIMARHGLGE